MSILFSGDFHANVVNEIEREEARKNNRRNKLDEHLKNKGER
jgi:hypothetical protein